MGASVCHYGQCTPGRHADGWLLTGIDVAAHSSRLCNPPCSIHPQSRNQCDSRRSCTALIASLCHCHTAVPFVASDQWQLIGRPSSSPFLLLLVVRRHGDARADRAAGHAGCEQLGNCWSVAHCARATAATGAVAAESRTKGAPEYGPQRVDTAKRSAAISATG
jgi:hypothetical protein